MVKLGALVWPQYSDWQALRDTGALVDRLGYDSLWTWDTCTRSSATTRGRCSTVVEPGR
jgi:hypothetical protein